MFYIVCAKQEKEESEQDIINRIRTANEFNNRRIGQQEPSNLYTF